MKLYAVVHSGYDFDPTILSLWHTKQDAENAIKNHYSIKENADFPWNTCYVRRIWTNARIHWSGTRNNAGRKELEG